jgi:hydrogenase expression/formation protein HypC
MCLAVPGRVTAVDGQGELRSARVDFGGVMREASLVFVPEAGVGDYVLVHVGFAIARIDEEAAQKALEALAAVGEVSQKASGDRDATS